ncbi:helix-turn-helix transcriptional regulator [Aurantimonas sp. C2-3-R2]|uniref:helix-turn-helix transcriptional regulator n=1 Tax=unclassified Aurantimonas TaxID=2638230 RepID=UPI003FA4CE60
MSPIKRIRLHVFKLKQKDFADLAGVQQSTVSRWEAGTSLSWPEMQRIREAASKAGIRWDDKWFFEPAPERIVRRSAKQTGAAA